MKGKNYKELSGFNKLLLGFNILLVICLLLSYLSTYISPQAINFMAFFGLMYPVFLLPSLLLMVYWLLKRKKQFLWSLVAILVGFTHFSHYFQITFSDRNEKEREQEFSIMSYNVRDFNLYDWINNKETKAHILKFLKEENPDVICFQEFYNDDRPISQFVTRDSIVQLIDAKNYFEGYTASGKNGIGLFGNVTFSKYPIIGQGHVKFENDKGNSFIFTDLLIDSDTVRVYNAHIGSVGFQPEDYEMLETEGKYTRLSVGYSKRVSQTKKLLDHSAKSPYPVVICGDFNDTPVSYNYRELTKDYWDAFTLSGNGIQGTYTKVPFLRIDYIFHSNDFNSFDFHTHGQELSDHRAISTIIEF